MVVYQKASVGVHFILLYLFKERKKKSEIKRRNKFLKEKKNIEKKNRVILLYCFIFNKRFEENKKVVSGLA